MSHADSESAATLRGKHKTQSTESPHLNIEIVPTIITRGLSPRWLLKILIYSLTSSSVHICMWTSEPYNLYVIPSFVLWTLLHITLYYNFIPFIICFQNLHTNLEFNFNTSTPTEIKMESSRNVFWGLVIKPGKRYETEVQEPFRITKVQYVLNMCVLYTLWMSLLSVECWAWN